jgi:S-disulfanyl-L-cysteine oxidoreductase SoxD
VLRRPILITVVLSGLLLAAVVVDAWPRRHRAEMPERFGFGTPASIEDINQSQNEVTPDGRGLPHDSGTVAKGDSIYALRCAACHGATGTEGPFDRLVGREPGDSFNFARDPNFLAKRTIGNYWPYATTLYDYIHRAMPFDAPGSLRSDEVYSVVAYLLYLNKIVPATVVISDRTLPLVRMPARNRFVADDRKGGRTIR